MNVFEHTRQLLDRRYTLQWEQVPDSDPRFAAIQRALECLQRLAYDDYIEAVYEFHLDSMPGGPYLPPTPERYCFFWCS